MIPKKYSLLIAFLYFAVGILYFIFFREFFVSYYGVPVSVVDEDYFVPIMFALYLPMSAGSFLSFGILHLDVKRKDPDRYRLLLRFYWPLLWKEIVDDYRKFRAEEIKAWKYSL